MSHNRIPHEDEDEMFQGLMTRMFRAGWIDLIMEPTVSVLLRGRCATL